MANIRMGTPQSIISIRGFVQIIKITANLNSPKIAFKGKH